MLTRRNVAKGAVGAGAALAAVSLLGACANQTTTQLQQDAQTLASGVSAVVTDLQAIPGVTIPASTLANINTAIASINANAAAIAAALTPAASVLTGIQTAVSTLSTLLSPFFPEAPVVAATIQAAVTLVATMLSEAGIATTASSAMVSMSPNQARLILKAASAK